MCRQENRQPNELDASSGFGYQSKPTGKKHKEKSASKDKPGVSFFFLVRIFPIFSNRKYRQKFDSPLFFLGFKYGIQNKSFFLSKLSTKRSRFSTSVMSPSRK